MVTFKTNKKDRAAFARVIGGFVEHYSIRMAFRSSLVASIDGRNLTFQPSGFLETIKKLHQMGYLIKLSPPDEAFDSGCTIWRDDSGLLFKEASTIEEALFRAVVVLDGVGK